MMNAATFDEITLRAHVANKRQLFKLLSKNIADLSRLETAYVSEALIEAERTSPSAVGAGVGVCALTLQEISKPVSFIITLSSSIEYDAPDNKAVDVIFVLVSPQDYGGLHLQKLSALHRLARHEAVIETLRDAVDGDMARAILDGAAFLKHAA